MDELQTGTQGTAVGIASVTDHQGFAGLDSKHTARLLEHPGARLEPSESGRFPDTVEERRVQPAGGELLLNHPVIGQNSRLNGFRAEFAEKDAESQKVLDFLEQISPEQYVRKLADSNRRIKV